MQLSRRWALIGAVLAGAALESGPAAVILETSVASGTRHVTLAGAAEATELILGPGEESDWIVRGNTAGATVFESTTSVSGNPWHSEGLVVAAQQQGEQVTMFSGYHQSAVGVTTPHQPFALNDAAYYAKYPNVKVIDTSAWTDAQRAAAIDSTPGVVIVNTCYGACPR